MGPEFSGKDICSDQSETFQARVVMGLAVNNRFPSGVNAMETTPLGILVIIVLERRSRMLNFIFHSHGDDVATGGEGDTLNGVF